MIDVAGMLSVGSRLPQPESSAVQAVEKPQEDKFDRAALRQLADAAASQAGLRVTLSAAETGQIAHTTAPPADALDLRHLPWSAIDTDTCDDPDQVVWAEKLPDGTIRVRVAVADVDALVPKDSPLDQRATHNGATLYTPVHNYAMLPDDFCTAHTTLLPERPRQSVVTEFAVGTAGQVWAAAPYRALVQSHAQLRYRGAGHFLTTGDGGGLPLVPGLETQIQVQDEAAQRLRCARLERGAIVMGYHPVRDTDNPASAIPRARALIEEFMIATNVANAEFMDAKGYSYIARSQTMTPGNWQALVALARQHKVALPPHPDAKALSALLDKKPALSGTIAHYLGTTDSGVSSDVCGGHFAQGVARTARSTGPNRQDEDLVNQRILKAAIDGQPSPYTVDELRQRANYSQQMHQTLTRVSRSVAGLVNAATLQGAIGQTFAGIVTGAIPGGAFVQLDNDAGSGFLDQSRAKVGEKVHVRVSRVDVGRGRVTLKTAPATPRSLQEL